MSGNENGSFGTGDSIECVRLLENLRHEISERPTDWRSALLNVISNWPIADEIVDGEQYHYIIGGEAFNWKRLAERLVLHLESSVPDNPAIGEMQDWLHSDHVFGGFEETEFRRTLGVDKWRGHLNYFYGVHLEQCLFAAIQNRIYRRRFSRGMPLTDDSAEEAFVGLYDDDEAALWALFREQSKSVDATEDEVARSLALGDEFTYWLFKRRIDSTHPAQVAYETQRGLEMLALITNSDERRRRMLMNVDGGRLLEFAVIGSTGR